MAYVYPEEFSDLATSQLKLDVTPEIQELEKDVTLFTTFLMNLGPGKKAGGTSYKHEWEEQNPEDLDDTLGAAYTAGATSISVSNSAYFTVGDQIKDTDSGDVFVVTAISDPDLTVTFVGEGSQAGSAAATDDNIKIIGSAFEIGSEKPTPRQKALTNVYNLMQISKESFQIAGSVDAATMNVNVGERNRLRKLRLATHKKKLERAFWWGERKSDTSGDNARYFMRGVFKFATENNTDAGAVATESEFDAWQRDIFFYGGSRKILFADAILMEGINAWYKGKMQLTPKGEAYGVPNMRRYIGPYGVLDLVYNRLFVDDYSGYAVAIDPDCVQVIPMDSDANGTRYNRYWTNVQEEGSDKFEDLYLTELTMEFSNIKRHGVFYGYSSIG